ncbi:hypothetical protein ACJ41O_000291 [Fusarium nematophilum]
MAKDPKAQTQDGSPSEGQNTPDINILDPRGEVLDDDFDDDTFYRKFAEPPSHCTSKQDIHQRRTSWLSITIYVLSLYSTVMSGIWLVTAILQPRWGHGISSRHGLLPSTATTLAALLAKTIEMSFVTVFVSCLGQVLTRRAFIRKAQGMSLAEMTMRNWVIQPGSLITHFETLPSSSMTLLGMLSLTATFAAAFYTTASDAMVAPKLKSGSWQSRELEGYVRASYANAQYVSHDCPYLFDMNDDSHAAESCMNVQFSGQSYRNLLNFMTRWTHISHNDTRDVPNDLKRRPTGNTLLFDNTTMMSTWIETEHGNVTAQYEETGRIINNVTLALPHPGVYGAATLPDNGILQPDDLAGVGEYAVRAGVVSPSVNVMCVTLGNDTLAPLVYTEWPDARVEKTGVGDQTRGWMGWEGEVPQSVYKSGKKNYLNRTDVDDIFEWGPKYDRRPPVFQMYPYDFNLLTNATVADSDAIYMLGKTADYKNYTLCQLRSWVSPNCSTQFNISGTAGASMKAHCEDNKDENSYRRSFPRNQGWAPPSTDWKWLADQWRLSMDLNGGSINNNASNARILTQLALHEPSLPSSLPSMAEAIAVYSSALVLISSIDTPFRHYWDYDADDNMVTSGPGFLQPFNASLITQEYTSGHTNSWQSVFYVVLALVFATNLFCLGYFAVRSGLVTDFTEPQNMFALAVNSPPSVAMNGSCGGGPEKGHLKVPWRVAYAPSANHYFFEDDGRGKEMGVTMSSLNFDPDAYSLKIDHFSDKISQARTAADQQWRRDTTKTVIAAFEQVKQNMSPKTARKTYDFLREDKWISNARSPGLHPASMPTLFYTWECNFSATMPSYPVIDDPEREWRLFNGIFSSSDQPDDGDRPPSSNGSAVSEDSDMDSPLCPGCPSCVSPGGDGPDGSEAPEPGDSDDAASDGNSNNEEMALVKDESKPGSSATATVRSDNDQVTAQPQSSTHDDRQHVTSKSDLHQRLSEFLGQEVAAQLSEVQDDVKAFEHHMTKVDAYAAKVQLLSSKVEDHSSAAQELMRSIVDRLSSKAKRAGGGQVGDEQARKRRREG